MDLVAVAPLRATAFVFQPLEGRFALVVVQKLTFLLTPEECVLAPEQEEIREQELHFDDDPRRSLRAPSDVAPFKSRADVLLVGSAFAPGGRPVRTLTARLAVAGMEKAIEVHGPRLFTPAGELPFAGHPTLGSAWAWRDAGGRPRADGELVQQCGIGLVRVGADGDRLRFAAPDPLRRGPATPGEAAGVAAALGVAPDALEACEWVDNGPGWIGARVADLDALYALTPRASALKIGVAAPAADGSAYHVRAFTRGAGGVVEDPVTGSLNASVAQWWVGRGWATPPYPVRQGRAVGADGVVEITRDDAGALWVGGAVRLVIRGTVDVSPRATRRTGGAERPRHPRS